MQLNTNIYRSSEPGHFVDWSFDCLPQNIYVKNITQQCLTSEGF